MPAKLCAGLSWGRSSAPIHLSNAHALHEPQRAHPDVGAFSESACGARCKNSHQLRMSDTRALQWPNRGASTRERSTAPSSPAKAGLAPPGPVSLGRPAGLPRCLAGKPRKFNVDGTLAKAARYNWRCSGTFGRVPGVVASAMALAHCQKVCAISSVGSGLGTSSTWAHCRKRTWVTSSETM